MRETDCLLCERMFTPKPAHPMWEEAYCPVCWAVIGPMRWELYWAEQMPAGEFLTAMRVDDV